MDAPPLRDKVALITAGSAGLGKATALALASLQMKVVINYSSNSSRAEQLINQLCKYHGSKDTDDSKRPRFLAIKADISQRAEANRLVAETVAKMGRLDDVFSNHGWTKMTHFTDLGDNVDEEDWDRAFDMNVKSHLFLMHAAREHLDATKGTFITTASTAGVRATGSSVAYAVTKAAQIHLVKCLAVIAKPERTRQLCFTVNDAYGMYLARIWPVSFESLTKSTQDWSAAFPQAKRDASIRKAKLGRLVTVEDVAEQVCCFVKSQSVTGENAVLDCGSRL